MFKADLTGRRYGKLVVTKYAGKRGKYNLWECKCDCGNTTKVMVHVLNAGKTISCGCAVRDVARARRQNLIGKRFGRLVVVESVEQETSYVWRCVCDCGNEITAKTADLNRGHVSSCGCLRFDRIRESSFNDLSGQKFGRLTVLQLHSRDRIAKWLCECACGCLTVVSGCALVTGNTKSCGCGSREALERGRYKHGKSHTKEMKAFWARARRERKQDQDYVWTPEMEDLLRATFTSCVICGSEDRLAVDHVYPLSKGHGLKPGNAVILCKGCNSKKSRKLPKELDKEAQEKILSSALLYKRVWNNYLIDYLNKHYFTSVILNSVTVEA